MNPEEKLSLITKDLQEVIDQDKITAILKERDLNVYWGTAPTGKPHLGYLVPMLKIAELLKAGCKVTILFADMHAYLDNLKSTWEQLEYRTQFYELLIKELLKAVDAPLDKLTFVKGSDFQFDSQYTLDVYKISTLASTRDTKKAGAEVVKQAETPKMSALLYPVLQALDEVYLKCDVQFGGVDQRKIFMFAREFLPKIGYTKQAYLMNPLIPGLGESGKMSSSEPNSKVDFDDTDKQIRKKINKAFSEDGKVEGNGLLAIARYIVFKKLDHTGEPFQINRPEQYGGNISYASYQELEDAFASKALSSIDLKQGLGDYIVQMVTPIRAFLEEHQDLIKKAYE